MLRYTHEDLPPPVGPRMALRPGLMIPLQTQKQTDLLAHFKTSSKSLESALNILNER